MSNIDPRPTAEVPATIYISGWRTLKARRHLPGWSAKTLALWLVLPAAAEGEDWVWHGANTLPPLHERAMLSLSRGGSDAAVLREYDLARKCFVEGGFHLREAKGGAQWLDADTLLLRKALGGGDTVTRSGYARQVRLWRRGTEPLSGPVLFEAGKESVGGHAYLDKTAPGERIFFYDQVGFFESECWLGTRSGPQTKTRFAEGCLAWLSRQVVRAEDALTVDRWRHNICTRHAAWRPVANSAEQRSGAGSAV
jgi:prolyl oligopeptidase